MIINQSNIITIAVPISKYDNDIIKIKYCDSILLNTNTYTFRLGTKNISNSYIIKGFDISNKYLYCNPNSNVNITINGDIITSFSVETDMIKLNSILNYDGNLINITVQQITPHDIQELEFNNTLYKSFDSAWGNITQINRIINNQNMIYGVYIYDISKDQTNIITKNYIKLIKDNIDGVIMLLSDYNTPITNQIIDNIYNPMIIIDNNNMMISNNNINHCVPPIEAIYEGKYK